MGFLPYYTRKEYVGKIIAITPNPYWFDGDPIEEKDEQWMEISVNGGQWIETMPISCCLNFKPEVGDKVEVGIDDEIDGWLYRKLEK